MVRRKNKPRKKKSLLSLPFRFGKITLVLVVLAALGFGIWYSQQDDETQEAVNQRAIAVLVWVRDRRETNRKTDRWIEWVMDRIPASRGIVVDADALGADRYTLAGLPVADKRLQLLTNSGYVVGYDEQMENPAWVAYKLTYTPEGGTEDRPESFETDMRTRARVSHNDYTGSGFDRGHMAPNHAIGVVYGPQAQMETFLMSNVVPQQPQLNQGIWRLLEQQVSQSWLRRFHELWVITGPVYEKPVRRLASGVAIPSGFFKIVADVTDRDELRVIAVIIPQGAGESDDFSQYLVSVDEVEALTGFDFFSLLDDPVETPLEETVPARLW
ncbi:DNA/RNA non-specific endonuclease [Ruficoccus sp. ZRK36]|uniref:DNA/RNA non-specific endonuclease n=1 Tax=Ruficoccus sp. ZRK36 TaxID=2866311 RepID=UPI001C737645|nr:DNA/RNA non-specific endonuclease [Ruficoccus sp. ZRK36]QYY34619.1 DNA/RNA non-specific endonuclease [Ruficoccus sp. ZRK36]